jgi:hypothetical protein
MKKNVMAELNELRLRKDELDVEKKRLYQEKELVVKLKDELK